MTDDLFLEPGDDLRDRPSVTVGVHLTYGAGIDGRPHRVQGAMERFTPPPSQVFRTRSEAMSFLKQYKRHLRSRADLLEADVLGLGPDLREPVAYIVDALARNCGHFAAQNISVGPGNLGKGMTIDHFTVDDDLMDAYEDRFGEAAIEDAGRWLLRRLHGESSIFVAWAVGPIRFPDESHAEVLEDRLLFNLVDRDFVAVFSHHQWNHPECRRFYVKGRPRHPLAPR
jgi:hypothetical protein